MLVNHGLKSKPGSPDSATVGTSPNCDKRAEVPTFLLPLTGPRKAGQQLGYQISEPWQRADETACGPPILPCYWRGGVESRGG
jgi:hypothetical protein